MLYVYVKDGVVHYPYTVTDYRIANPGVSMRADPASDVLAELGLLPVTPTPEPPHDPITQDIARAAEKQGDTWVEVWAVSDAPKEAVAARLADKRASMVVTMRQARLALLAAGVLGKVDAALAALPSPAKEAALIEWEYAADVRRVAPLIAQLGPALGWSDAALDALFEEAAVL